MSGGIVDQYLALYVSTIANGQRSTAEDILQAVADCTHRAAHVFAEEVFAALHGTEYRAEITPKLDFEFVSRKHAWRRIGPEVIRGKKSWPQK
ncbi:hypothetical protein ELG97_37100 [Rhizobium leguminosarum]|uniref:hypothetical protein n=1 Tax=Rhizobium leguminosarum TaxID=384 RepID=UPI001031E08C|nr:hypothetical protein [Rhizobium leguminosarum]TBE73849.1 hypothetical protein ELG97_37100 [Rhizobium leguminosarum]